MPTTALTIRPATEGDTPTILRFIRDLADYEKLAHEVVADAAGLHAQLFGPTPRAEVLMAEDGGTPVGFALFFHTFSTFQAKPGLYLEDLFVAPAARCKGAGKALMLELARLAQARGCGRFEWSVLTWNTPSIDFYKRLGASVLEDWHRCRFEESGIAALAAAER